MGVILQENKFYFYCGDQSERDHFTQTTSLYVAMMSYIADYFSSTLFTGILYEISHHSDFPL